MSVWGPPAGLGASVGLANTVYGIHPRVIIDSAAHAVTAWDLITSMIKAWVFGVIISVVSSRLGLALWVFPGGAASLKSRAWTAASMPCSRLGETHSGWGLALSEVPYGKGQIAGCLRCSEKKAAQIRALVPCAPSLPGSGATSQSASMHDACHGLHVP